MDVRIHLRERIEQAKDDWLHHHFPAVPGECVAMLPDDALFPSA